MSQRSGSAASRPAPRRTSVDGRRSRCQTVGPSSSCMPPASRRGVQRRRRAGARAEELCASAVQGAVAPEGAPTQWAPMQKVLVVDDDPGIREVVCFALQKAGYATAVAADGEQELARFAADRPALVVLDILMPEFDGVEVCRRLRADPRGRATPIVFLSSKDDEVDRIVGLEVGGDDYVAKPFSPRELVARVKAILRRVAAPAEKTEPPLRHGRLALDAGQYKAYWDGKEL